MPSKKNAIISALQGLMREPGSRGEIALDFAKSIFEFSQQQKLALAGYPNYDDRGAAIVFCSMVERALEVALMTHFTIDEDASRRLFSYTDDGVLSSFNSKTAMGFALGVFDSRMYDDLKWIARIRNAFAHSRIEVGFNSQPIAAACEQLKMGEFLDDGTYTPRQRFTVSSMLIAMYLEHEVNGPLMFKKRPMYGRLYETKARLPQSM